jgi:hypothetical protein
MRTTQAPLERLDKQSIMLLRLCAHVKHCYARVYECCAVASKKSAHRTPSQRHRAYSDSSLFVFVCNSRLQLSCASETATFKKHCIHACACGMPCIGMFAHAYQRRTCPEDMCVLSFTRIFVRIYLFLSAPRMLYPHLPPFLGAKAHRTSPANMCVYTCIFMYLHIDACNCECAETCIEYVVYEVCSVMKPTMPACLPTKCERSVAQVKLLLSVYHGCICHMSHVPEHKTFVWDQHAPVQSIEVLYMKHEHASNWLQWLRSIPRAQRRKQSRHLHV